MRKQVTVAHAIDVLNRALATDPAAVRALIEYRVPCNERLAYDPTIQCGLQVMPTQTGDVVGVLGLINGIFGVDGKSRGFIAAEYDEEAGRLLRFVAR